MESRGRGLLSRKDGFKKVDSRETQKPPDIPELEYLEPLNTSTPDSGILPALAGQRQVWLREVA